MESPLNPKSPYGETKVIGEWLARDFGVAWGMSWVDLPNFNVAGAGSDDLGDTSVNNLIPMFFRALGQGQRPRVFGDDYPTPGGTCIRDYIHMADLASAHVAAAAWTESGVRAADILNVGRGSGVDRMGGTDIVSFVHGLDGNSGVVRRRAGDLPTTFAATVHVQRELGWRATKDLSEMAPSAWSAWQASHTARPHEQVHQPLYVYTVTQSMRTCPEALSAGAPPEI
jgi:UDP-glucose 4-epimerase